METTSVVRVICFSCDRLVEMDMAELECDSRCPLCDEDVSERRRIEGFRILPVKVG